MAPSIIGEDLTISGNIVSKGDVQVDGEIQGDVYCASLVIGDKGRVLGGVVAEEVIVHGRVDGSIHAVRVTLESTCHVEGDICHKILKLEHGGYFEGGSRRSDDPISVAANDDDNITQATPAFAGTRLKPATKLERAA